MTTLSPNSSFIDSFRAAPFRLDDEALAWVRRSYEGMGPRHRLAQLFNVMLTSHDPAHLAELAAMQPGGVTHFLPVGMQGTWSAARTLSQGCEVPLLFSADVEGGAILPAGITPMPSQLGMAAMGSAPLYEQAVGVLAREAAAVGINWSFTPVVDINAEFRSAIVPTRSFGSDPATIGELSRVHVRAMQANGVAATAKHWPGEGFDARDQHLVTTINPLDMDQWRSSFGKLYAQLIDDGVKSIMSAHIALPAYAREQGVDGVEAFRPASVSRLLNIRLLREELGFGGVVVSDATPMAGLSSWAPRAQALPELIENGCDMILFTPDLAGEIGALEQALADGRLSAARVEQSVLRILAMKASLGLHKAGARPLDGGFEAAAAQLGTAEHQRVSEAAAAASVTLVKDVQQLLPLKVERHRRVVLVREKSRPEFEMFGPTPLIVGELLAAAGFEVSEYDPQQPPAPGSCDLVIYLLAQESQLTKANIYLDWVGMLGPFENAMRRPWHEIPCLMVSFGQPYYLYDAPRMPCVVNAYTAIEPVQRAVVRKLLGEEGFAGVSPVDAFCGLGDAHF